MSTWLQLKRYYSALVLMGWCCTSVMAQSASSPAGSPDGLSAQEIARVFYQACLLTEGETNAVIDWALAQGFETVNPMRGSSTEALLAGQPGTVLEVPGSGGAVLLAAAEGARCTVWADRTLGPPLRLAMAETMGQLRGKGARVLVEVDRSIERAGARRNHVQWRYRAVGGSQDYGVAVVSTLATEPGSQALNLSPLPPVSAIAPDGLPLR